MNPIKTVKTFHNFHNEINSLQIEKRLNLVLFLRNNHIGDLKSLRSTNPLFHRKEAQIKSLYAY